MFPIPVFDIDTVPAGGGLRPPAARLNSIGQTQRIESRLDRTSKNTKSPTGKDRDELRSSYGQ